MRDVMSYTRGNKGQTGQTGDAGDPGVQGRQGPKGIQGWQGPRGRAGGPGLTGQRASALFIVLLLASVLIGYLVLHSFSAKVQQLQTNACAAGNVRNAYLRGRAGEFTVTLRPGVRQRPSSTTRASARVLPIVNCQATYDQNGRIVRLPVPVERAFIHMVIDRQRLPTIRTGRIVGSTPFPPPVPGP